MSSLAHLLFRTVDGVFAVDAAQRIVFWNSGCTHLLGIPPNAALGQPCSRIVRGKDPSGQPFCGGGCCVTRLNQGQSVPGTFPLRACDARGQELRLTVSLLLVPSLRKEQWLCLHLLRRGEAANLFTMLEDCPSYVPRFSNHRIESCPECALSTREQEILQLLAEGLSISVISHLLHISVITVRNHVQHIQEKLGVHSQAETVAYAYRHNLV